MDYTTVFRPLIYKDRKDIDEFPVDETDNTDYITMESVFMEKLEERPFIITNYNAPELLLMIFNNARYITTLIFSENHPQHYLHKYLKIAENNSKDIIICNHAMPATMALVINYLLHYNGEIFYGSRIVKAIIENFKDWDTKGASEGKQDFFDLLIDRTSETDKYPRWTTDDGEFSRRDIQEVLNDVDIDPYEIIGGIDYIIEETLGVYSGDPECIQIMKAVITLVENFERTESINETTRESLDYAFHKLKKLKKEYPGCMPEWEEDNSIIIPSKNDFGVQDLSLQSSRMLSPYFDPDSELLHGQIEDLKDQVNQLAKEKATIEKNNHDLVAREEHHRNEKDKARAENQKLLDKIAELEKELAGKDVEPEFDPEDIMITENRKIDVIKILHAMCKIGLLQKKNGSKITINAVMKFFGKMLNDNFTEYSSNLSTSKSKTKEPSYMQVFEDLRQAAYDYFKKS